jgi:hypothetical protein
VNVSASAHCAEAIFMSEKVGNKNVSKVLPVSGQAGGAGGL